MRFFNEIEGQPVNPPSNQADVVLDFDLQKAEVTNTLSTNEYEWRDEEATLLNNHFLGGFTGATVGAMEGLEHVIRIVDGAESMTIINIIETETATYDTDLVIATSSPEEQIDWLNGASDGVSFRRLYEEGKLTKEDRVMMPYVLSSIPDYEQAFITTLAFTTVVLNLRRSAAELTGEVAEAATLIDTIGAVIRLVFRLIFIVAMVLTLFQLIIDFFNFIIQRVKYYATMQANKLIAVGANHFGMQYKSTMLQNSTYDRLYIVPKVFSQPRNTGDLNFRGAFSREESEALGFPDCTYGDFLRRFLPAFGAKVVITNRVMDIVPIDFVPNTVSYKVKPVDQFQVQPNGDEIRGHFTLSFRYDVSDANTIENWQGNNVEVWLRPKNVKDKTKVRWKGDDPNQIGFARLRRKEDLSVPEKIASAILKVIGVALNIIVGVINTVIEIVNTVTDVVNVIIKGLKLIGVKVKFEIPDIPKLNAPDFTNLIEDRIGIALTQFDYFTEDKMFLLDFNPTDRLNKISDDNDEKIRAKYIYENYYNHKNKFKLNRQLTNLEVTLQDIKNIQDERAVLLPNNRVAIVETGKALINASDGRKVVDLFTQEIVQWTTNYVIDVIEPEGQ